MLNRIAVTILISIVVIVILTTIMTFTGVGQEEYMPYIYFVVALVILSAILPTQPLSMIV
jgi:hypothetical protein